MRYVETIVSPRFQPLENLLHGTSSNETVLVEETDGDIYLAIRSNFTEQILLLYVGNSYKENSKGNMWPTLENRENNRRFRKCSSDVKVTFGN